MLAWEALISYFRAFCDNTVPSWLPNHFSGDKSGVNDFYFPILSIYISQMDEVVE